MDRKIVDRPEDKEADEGEEILDPTENLEDRTQLAQQADQYDYEAANELFDLYKSIRQPKGADVSEDSNKAEKQSQARKQATLEGTGNRNKGTKKVYRRADLIKMKMQDPERYNTMQDEIMRAYQEGRVK